MSRRGKSWEAGSEEVEVAFEPRNVVGIIDED